MGQAHSIACSKVDDRTTVKSSVDWLESGEGGAIET
jgi:hypothetical protein